MILTTYQHSCFTLEKEGGVLVVDPGGWSEDFQSPDTVVGVVITHEHQDHLDPKKLQAIHDKNPKAIIYANQDVTKQLDSSLPFQTVTAGESITVGPFTVEFFGGQHAIIHVSYPRATNLGIIVDNNLCFPGDSLDIPNGKAVKTLALPVTAPWSKVSETIDYIVAMKAPFVFPVHDAILSDDGKSLYDRLAGNTVATYGGTYQRISAPTEI